MIFLFDLLLTLFYDLGTATLDDLDCYVMSIKQVRPGSNVPNQMQMRQIYCFRSFAFNLAHVKFDV